MGITENLTGGLFSGIFDVAALIIILAIVAVLFMSKDTANIVQSLGQMFSNAISAAKSG